MGPCFALAALLFLLLHALVQRLSQQPFPVAFRLARGLASVVLSALGFFALIRFHEFWRTVYVLPAPDALASALVGIPIGHFAADFLLLGYAWIAGRHRPRVDLVVHHALGLIAAVLTVRLPVAAPLYLLLFTTEMMPITTGLTALGTLTRRPRLELLGARLRLGVLLLWRIPLWLWVAFQIATELLTTTPPPAARIIYLFSSLFLVVTLGLDLFWSAQSLRALRRLARAQSSLRTSASISGD